MSAKALSMNLQDNGRLIQRELQELQERLARAEADARHCRDEIAVRKQLLEGHAALDRALAKLSGEVNNWEAQHG